MKKKLTIYFSFLIFASFFITSVLAQVSDFAPVCGTGTTTINSYNFLHSDFSGPYGMGPYGTSKIYDIETDSNRGVLLTVGKYFGGPTSPTLTFPKNTTWNPYGFILAGSPLSATSQGFLHQYTDPYPKRVAVGPYGKTYFGGQAQFYTPTADFGLLGVSDVKAGSKGLFLTRVSPYAGYEFTFLLNTVGQPQIDLIDLDADGSGNIIIAAKPYGQFDFDPHPTNTAFGPPNGGYVIAPYAPPGTLNWIYTFPSLNQYAHQVRALNIDPATNMISATGQYNTGSAAGAGFLLVLNQAGATLSLDLIKGAIGNDVEFTNGRIFLTGSFVNTVDFDLTNGTYLVSSSNTGNRDGFTASYMTGAAKPAILWVDAVDNNGMVDDNIHVEVTNCGEVVVLGQAHLVGNPVAGNNVTIRAMQFNGAPMSNSVFPISIPYVGNVDGDPISTFWADQGGYFVTLSHPYDPFYPMIKFQGGF